MTALKRSRTNPALAICEILRYPLPKTIALGGVDTGSINPAEAAIVALIAYLAVTPVFGL